MSKHISRRAWLTSVPALGGLLVTGCSRERFVPPRVRGGLIGVADVLTMSTNRLLLSGLAVLVVPVDTLSVPALSFQLYIGPQPTENSPTLIL